MLNPLHDENEGVHRGKIVSPVSTTCSQGRRGYTLFRVELESKINAHKKQNKQNKTMYFLLMPGV